MKKNQHIQAASAPSLQQSEKWRLYSIWSVVLLVFALLIPVLSNAQTTIGGVNLGDLPNYHMFFSNGSDDANWQGATKGFIGDMAIDGIQADERTSGTVPYAGTIYTNDVTLDAWQDIVDDNAGQAFGSTGQTTLIANLETSLENVFTQINAVTATAGYSSVLSTSLDGLNTQNSIAETYVINVTSGFTVSSQIDITGDASDAFIFRWDTDANFSDGYEGNVKFQSGGVIIPHGGLVASNFLHVAGKLESSGGGSNPPAPFPQGPRDSDGTGALIAGGADFNGGGFFTGYWFTTGTPTNNPGGEQAYGDNGTLSNGIFVGGWYSKNTNFSMTSGTSGVYVSPNITCTIGMTGNTIDVTCNGNNNGSIDISVSGAQGAVTYLWSDGSTDEDHANLAPGPYSVTVTDAAGCQSTQSFTINEPAVLGMTGVVNDVTITNGSDGSIDVTPTGGTSPYTYLWSDGSTDEDRTNLVAGTYIVTVTDANGCPYTNSFTVDEPECTIGMTGNAIDVTCNGNNDGSIDITVSGAQGAVTYLWSDGSTDEDRTNLAPGTYSVTVTDEGGCQSTESFTIYEPAVLGMTGIVNDVTTVGGSDGSIDITVNGGTSPYTFLWSDGSTNEDQTNLAPGTYSVTVTDANGCPYTTSFTVDDIVCTITIDAGPDLDKCHNDPAQLNAVASDPDATYSWSPASGVDNPNIANPVTNVYATTTFTVTATGTDGCMATDEVTVTAYPTVKAGISVKPNNGSCQAPCVNLFTKNNANYSYEWRLNGVAIVGAENKNTYCACVSGSYSVKVNDEVTGCKHTSKKFEVTIAPKMEDGDLVSQNSTMSFTASPNPTSDVLNVTIHNAQEGTTTIQLMDMLGRIVIPAYAGSIANDQTVTFNMNGLSNGVYLVKIESGNFKEVQKVILNK